MKAVRDGEDDVVILDGKKILMAFLGPSQFSEVLALGTTPVATAVV